MKALKITAIVILVGYPLLVIAFETWLGISQPQSDRTIVITTTDDDGQSHDRVVSLLETNDQMYVAVNHWPRAWYYRLLDNPDVQVTMDGETGDYTATEIAGSEEETVEADHPTGIVFRILTGFPPRYFVRLDPVS